MKFKKTNQKGFTLIELLVVVAIISLLSSVVLASLKDAREKAKLATIQEGFKTIQIEAELYRSSNGNYSSEYVTLSNQDCLDSVQGMLSNSAIKNVLIQSAQYLNTSDFLLCGFDEDKYVISIWVKNLNVSNVKTICLSQDGLVFYPELSYDEVFIADDQTGLLACDNS